MDKDLTKESLDSFKRKCREYGLKVTPQRIGIYAELKKSKEHPSTERIFRLVRKKFPKVSMDTVNRTMLTFIEIGLVDVVETMGGPRRHDPDLSSHHHFLCVSCNEIINFHGIQYDQLPIPDQIQNKCTVYSKRVVFTGLCERCSKSPKARETKREV